MYNITASFKFFNASFLVSPNVWQPLSSGQNACHCLPSFSNLNVKSIFYAYNGNVLSSNVFFNISFLLAATLKPSFNPSQRFYEPVEPVFRSNGEVVAVEEVFLKAAEAGFEGGDAGEGVMLGSVLWGDSPKVVVF